MSSIEELFNEYRDKVNVAAYSFYAWKNINNLAVQDTSLFQALQRNPAQEVVTLLCSIVLPTQRCFEVPRAFFSL